MPAGFFHALVSIVISLRPSQPPEQWSQPEPARVARDSAVVTAEPGPQRDLRPTLPEHAWVGASVPIGGSERAPGPASASRPLVLTKTVKPSDPDAKVVPVTGAACLALGSVGIAAGGLLWLAKTPPIARYGAWVMKPKVLKVGPATIVGLNGEW